MTRTIGIDFSFTHPVDVSDTVHTLIKGGMTPLCDGALLYLIDEDGLFNWQKTSPSTLAEVLTEMGNRRWADRTVGMLLLFPGAERDFGGDLLFHPGRTCLSYAITINAKRLPNSIFCDMGWYLQRLVPSLEPLGLSEVETQDSP
ncbi:hypothetical protein AB0H44_19190 [Streptomyces pseudogriseolus]|uniref:hypothetical protein n=1 Tax=Streptomyces pseudogriseolus TaxID=36817 RepID=UPI00349AFF89